MLYAILGLAVATCQLQSANGRWMGSCGVLFGEHRTLTLAPAKSITTGVWRKDATPTSVWAGDITDSGSSPYAVEVEQLAGRCNRERHRDRDADRRGGAGGCSDGVGWHVHGG